MGGPGPLGLHMDAGPMGLGVHLMDDFMGGVPMGLGLGAPQLLLAPSQPLAQSYFLCWFRHANDKGSPCSTAACDGLAGTGLHLLSPVS